MTEVVKSDGVDIDGKPVYLDDPGHCHADRDGDCTWDRCPQLRDDEPARSNRSCPLWIRREDDRW